MVVDGIVIDEDESLLEVRKSAMLEISRYNSKRTNTMLPVVQRHANKVTWIPTNAFTDIKSKSPRRVSLAVAIS